MYEKITQSMKERAKVAREHKRAIIAESLYNEGIIPAKNQRTISGDDLLNAFRIYVKKCLYAEMLKKSTGYKGKYADVFNRVQKAINRELQMDIVDFACRDATLPDITVYADEKTAEKLGKASVQVEIKTNGGVLATGKELAECYEVLARACENGKWFVWYFDIDNFDPFAENAEEEFDYLPHLFMPIDELLEKLTEYKGDIDTWLREPTNTTVNFQNLSPKKRKFLYSLTADSYDWPTFRDYGKLKKQG